MAKEYIERDYLVKEAEAVLDFRKKYYTDVARIADAAATVEWLKYYAPTADVVEVFRPEEDVLAEFEDDYKDFKKIKTHLAQIIVEGEIEKPYYSILWWDEESKEYNIGYSSYCLDYVRKWLELVFDVVEEADVVEVKHGEWVDRYGGKYVNPKYECSECRKEAPYRPKLDDLLNWYHEQDLSDYCPNCGAKMDGDGE